ncbi:MAG: uracil-DNA glycosylase, partial [Terracidiphilus sp.]
MAQSLDSATGQALTARIRFYRDLGFTEFYRRPVDPALLAKLAAQTETSGGPGLDSETWDSPHASEDQPIPTRKPFPSAPAISDAVPAADRAAALQLIRDEIGDCTRCALHKGRNKLVFGDGSPAARLMFVGEGPGADEDAQGLPFVGKAGQLLNNMITAMGLRREEVYIANVVKC